MLTVEGETIIYSEQQLPLLLRLFVLILGLCVATGIPLPFLIHADWRSPDPTLVLAVIFIVFPLAVGGFLVAVSLWSASEVRLDPRAGRAERTLRGPILNRDEEFPLSDLSLSEVVMRDSDDGPYPLLRLTLPRGLPIDIACFTNRAEAERWQSRIAATLGV